MKTRWKILIAAGVLLVLLAASVFMTLRVQPENELEAYKQMLREQGEKLTIAEVVPPPVPPESNCVNAVEDAFRMSGSGSEKIPNAMKMVAPGKALIGWQQPEAIGADFTNSWEEFAAQIQADGPALELLQQVLVRPKLDFQLDYKRGFSMLLPHLAPMKHAAQKLESAAVCDLHAGDTGSAATNIVTLLALVQADASEGILISHLVRIAMAAIAVNPTWELLQTTNVTDAQLAAVQRGWEQMTFLRDAEGAFTFERAMMSDGIQKSRASHQGFEEIFGLMTSLSGSSLSGSSGTGGSWTWPPDWEELSEKPRYLAAEVLWRTSGSYSAERLMLQNQQVILEATRAMQTNQSQFYKADYDAMTKRLSKLGPTNTGSAMLRALKIPDFSEMFDVRALGNSIRRTLRMEAARRVTVTAIALKRFSLKHGKLPETIGEIVPEFISSLPIDPFDGKPLRYHANADGTYLLYCIGEDGVDDGGDPNVTSGSATGSFNGYFFWQNDRARDWVWPQPATAAEINYFFEHPPK